MRRAYYGKVLAEILKTKVNRHKVTWIGRSKYKPYQVRVGIQFYGSDKVYYYDWDSFISDARLSSYKAVSPEEANAIEAQLTLDRTA